MEEEIPTNSIINDNYKNVISDWPDNSVDLAITSPPYNVKKEYEEKVLSDEEYYEFLLTFFKNISRILKDKGGRICFNVPFSMNRKGETFYILPKVLSAMRESPLKFRDQIVWNQEHSGCATAWGSFNSPSSPWIRHMVEYIVVGFNERWKKDGEKSDLEKDEFMEYTLDKWDFQADTKWRNKHPATFPEELPYRCIKLFSYVGDIILDPFCGVGTTCAVAKKNNRKYIGIDIVEKYCKTSRERLDSI